MRKSSCLQCGQCSVKKQDKKQKDQQETTEIIQIRDNGDLNCGFNSGDGEKVQFKGIFQNLVELGVNWDMKYKKKKRMVNESQVLRLSYLVDGGTIY